MSFLEVQKYMKIIFLEIKEWLIKCSRRILTGFIAVFITIIFTFCPILLAASRPWTEGSFGENFWRKFLSYWENGEIVLPILGLCGFITVTLFRNGISRKWERILFFVVFVLALVSGSSVSESDGFEQPLAPEIIFTGYCIYLLLVFMCIGLIAAIEPPNPPGRNSNKNANILLKDVEKERHKSR